ncbi:TetR/AcrR family transcriptional regulator [Nocardioides sp. GY 10127]|uniref:TetR/AcrR family transcriptional regulator n=1 Tax=Nocardioides sp. GY 10127 TaxID=2569762 RepID=UPI0010A78B05|nr:TetR/AcrR family transcriptional regulator [Nocardioides sp. GY 10127]TIC84395.1 TetR/AcrR family transcriptional regulator [Nocardioides sp. GY 10127]
MSATAGTDRDPGRDPASVPSRDPASDPSRQDGRGEEGRGEAERSGRRVRLSPEQRRAQLLDLGVRLLGTRPLDQLSIDVLAEEAGISRGLLYHYFGNKHDFHAAVVRRAAEDLLARTEPPAEGEPAERLRASMAAYLDYVDDSYAGYLSLVRSAAGGAEQLRAIYEETREALVDRVLAGEPALVADSPAARLAVRGWAAFVEEVVLAWKAAPVKVGSGAAGAGGRRAGLTRDDLVGLVSDALPAVLLTPAVTA